MGANIDECLSLSVYIDVLCKKLQEEIGVLRRFSSFMPRAALLKIFNTIIFPHFNYCVQFWARLRTSQIVIVFLNYGRGLPELYYM